MTTTEATPLNDVLYAFAIANALPDPQTLDDFTRRYPQYAEELTALAVQLLFDWLDLLHSQDENDAAVSPRSCARDQPFSQRGLRT